MANGLTIVWKKTSLLAIVFALVASLFVIQPASAATKKGLTSDKGYSYTLTVNSKAKMTFKAKSKYKEKHQSYMVKVYREYKEGEGHGPGYWETVKRTSYKSGKSINYSAQLKRGETYRVVILTELNSRETKTNGVPEFKLKK